MNGSAFRAAFPHVARSGFALLLCAALFATRAVQALVGDELGSVELVSLGEHRLRDLAQPVEVFQVVAPGLARVLGQPRDAA